MEVVGGLMVIGLGGWLLLYGLSFFNFIKFDVLSPNCLSWRLPSFVPASDFDTGHAVLSCLAGPIFAAGGIVIVVSGFR